MKRRIFMILAAVLLAVAPVAVTPTATAFTNPVDLPNGHVRYDVMSSLLIGTGKLLTGNYSKGTVLIEYTDPTYGHQSALLHHNGVATMCADFTYHDSASIHVTYNPGTPQAITGTLNYIGSMGSQGLSATPQQARHALKQARHALRKAKHHHRRHAIIHMLEKNVQAAKQDLRHVLKQHSFCASRRVE